jgi:hypothetical protein
MPIDPSQRPFNDGCGSQPLFIANRGDAIADTNFWRSEYAQHGLFFISVNAGAFRLLVPPSWGPAIPDMRKGAKHMVISILPPEQWRDGKWVIEMMIEDGSDCPWSCQLSPAQVDRVPADTDKSQQWTASVWEGQRGQPVKRLERPAYLRIVSSLPCLQPFDFPSGVATLKPSTTR